MSVATPCAVLTVAAHIGDFRELHESSSLATLNASPPYRLTDPTTATALKLCCWLNTQEKGFFSAPFLRKDGNEKYAYFLPRIRDALYNIEALRGDWLEEYTLVTA